MDGWKKWMNRKINEGLNEGTNGWMTKLGKEQIQKLTNFPNGLILSLSACPICRTISPLLGAGTLISVVINSLIFVE